MRIVEVPWADARAEDLRESQRAEIAARYGTTNSEPGTPPSAADIAVFLVAQDDQGTGIGCGGLRDLGGGVGEIKRMYVTPAWRGRGVAERLLRELEAWARGQGWAGLRLETGHRQPDAVRFYTRCGYLPIARFDAYVDGPDSLCFERLL